MICCVQNEQSTVKQHTFFFWPKSHPLLVLTASKAQVPGSSLFPLQPSDVEWGLRGSQHALGEALNFPYHPSHCKRPGESSAPTAKERASCWKQGCWGGSGGLLEALSHLQWRSTGTRVATSHGSEMLCF